MRVYMHIPVPNTIHSPLTLNEILPIPFLHSIPPMSINHHFDKFAWRVSLSTTPSPPLKYLTTRFFLVHRSPWAPWRIL